MLVHLKPMSSPWLFHHFIASLILLLHVYLLVKWDSWSTWYPPGPFPAPTPKKGRAIGRLVRSYADIYPFLRVKWKTLYVPRLVCILCEVLVFPSALNKWPWPQACCGNGKKWLVFGQMQWGNGLGNKLRHVNIQHVSRLCSETSRRWEVFKWEEL